MKRIALIIGHRYSSQGAYGAAGMSEYTYWDEFLDDMLEKLGNQPNLKIFHREDRKGYTRNMIALHKEIDVWGADYAISFHFDAADSRQANGHTVLYNERSKDSKRVAKLFDELFDKYMKNSDRNLLGRYKGRGGGFLRRGKSINVLLEPFFASHQKMFIKGTPGYDALMSSVIDGLRSLGAITADYNGEAVEIIEPIQTHTYHLGRSSMRNLLATNNQEYIAAVKFAIRTTKQDFSVLEGGCLKPYPRSGNQSEVLSALMLGTVATLNH